MRVKFLADDASLREIIGRLSTRYEKLEAAVAWCGSPADGIPYDQLQPIARKSSILVGADFDHTHPDGLAKLREFGAAVRIVSTEEGIFHPKVYLFSRPGRAALLVGSANMTKDAFLTNKEAATLIEGSTAEMSALVLRTRRAMLGWRRESFKLNDDWLDNYRERYKKARKYFTGKRARLSPIAHDAGPIAPLTFIRKASWPEYYRLVSGRLRKERHADPWRVVLEGARSIVPGNLTVSMLDRRDVRSLLLGRGAKGRYAMFGSVTANGKGLPMFLKRGPDKQKRYLVRVFNAVRRMGRRTDYDKLLGMFEGLWGLRARGGSQMWMSTWGRILLLARPDTYPSICYDGVRDHLSKQLGIAKSRINTPESYVETLRLLHATPWFNSPRPSRPGEEQWIWDNRVAYIDALYYAT